MIAYRVIIDHQAVLLEGDLQFDLVYAIGFSEYLLESVLVMFLYSILESIVKCQKFVIIQQHPILRIYAQSWKNFFLYIISRNLVFLLLIIQISLIILYHNLLELIVLFNDQNMRGAVLLPQNKIYLDSIDSNNRYFAQIANPHTYLKEIVSISKLTLQSTIQAILKVGTFLFPKTPCQWK